MIFADIAGNKPAPLLPLRLGKITHTAKPLCAIAIPRRCAARYVGREFMMIRSLTLAGLATALAVTAFSITPSASAQRQPYAQCMTDDGYGRFRPCSALYKRQHPNWRAGSECMTDDGYGRLRPCSNLYWQGKNPTGQYNPSPYEPTTRKPPAY
jgi:hypothetical protein